MNKGMLMSLIHCEKCDMPIEIYSTWEKAICPCCKKEIDLNFEVNIQNKIV